MLNRIRSGELRAALVELRCNLQDAFDGCKATESHVLYWSRRHHLHTTIAIQGEDQHQDDVSKASI